MATYKEILCDANNLYEAYLKSARASKWKDPTQKFELYFLGNLFDLKDDLENQTLTNSPTYSFELHERGRIRVVAGRHIRDRIVRHVLCDEILLPKIKNHLIYDCCATIKNRGISMQRKRFEIHLKQWYQLHGNEGYILFGDFSKFYDNIYHSKVREQIFPLVEYDDYVIWLINLILSGFKIDVSYMNDEEFASCMSDLFNKLEYRIIPDELKTKEKFMEKSLELGDQFSQGVGVYYPHSIDNYVKYVRAYKQYGRYNDDFYCMGETKQELEELLDEIEKQANELGIHINRKKTRIVKISSNYKFLQIIYSLHKDGRVPKRINPKRVTEMRTKLKKLAVKVQNDETPYMNVENMYKGWMCNYYKLPSRTQRENLLLLYEELFNKSITIEHKKMIIRDKEEL